VQVASAPPAQVENVDGRGSGLSACKLRL